MTDLIRQQIREVIGDKGLGIGDFLEKIDVFPTEKEEFGHYSTNVAFKIAGVLNLAGQDQKPFQIANQLAEKLGLKTDIFFKVNALNGFVNFWLRPEILRGEIKQILNKERVRGERKHGLKINVEFVSANPTGPLTMANGRGGFYGDVLANVLEWAGNKVTREYYINDTGNQIKILGESILAAKSNISHSPAGEGGENLYKGQYIKSLSSKFNVKSLIGKDALGVGKKAAAILLVQIKKSLKNAGIKHQTWFSEDKKLHGTLKAGKKNGLINKILFSLIDWGLVIEKDGAKWLKTSEIADEKDRVLIKSDGQPTYFLSDLAYHFNKFGIRKFNKAIDIWGADHHGYVARLKSGVRVMGIDPGRLDIIITQMVRLIRDGKEVKISKRSGEFVTLDELLKEVGNDAARYFFLMHAPNTHMDFDLNLAKERSQKNPVYYVQYAYVRAVNILRKAKKGNGKSKMVNLNLLNSDSEMKLILEMIKLSDILRQTAKDYQVHRLTKYSYELAKAFHNFYEQERVVGVGGELESARLVLVNAVKITMETLFNILGISKPIRM